MSKLLTRDEFRKSVFNRDGGKCVICGEPAQDAHHIIDRRLWTDGGYYLDNGASVCGLHHIECEKTLISVETVREKAKVSTVLPEHLYSDEIYDKWGNIILSNWMRLKGELFYDESVQKILSEALHLFTDYVKYPRTYHLPWSDNLNEDDRMLQSLDGFMGKEVVATLKMDGENTTMYRDHIHARSISSEGHPSRNWVKNFWSSIRYEIPVDYRICGENLYAKHSIGYNTLDSYFMGFSVWFRNECLKWEDTLEWFQLLGIVPVKVIYDGIFDEEKIRSIKLDWGNNEGYVVRTKDGFTYSNFRRCVGKYVRKNHVMTTKHWMRGQALEKNLLK